MSTWAVEGLAGIHLGHAYRSAMQSCWATSATCKTADETGPPSTGRTRQQHPAREGWRPAAQTRRSSATTESPAQGALREDVVQWRENIEEPASRIRALRPLRCAPKTALNAFSFAVCGSACHPDACACLQTCDLHGPMRAARRLHNHTHGLSHCCDGHGPQERPWDYARKLMVIVLMDGQRWGAGNWVRRE